MEIWAAVLSTLGALVDLVAQVTSSYSGRGAPSTSRLAMMQQQMHAQVGEPEHGSLTEALPCAARDYGCGSIVCVCNSSYCDQLGKLGPRNGQLVTVVESNKAGLRFELSILAISKRTDDVTEARARRPSSNSVVVKLTIDRNVKHQEMLGFGGAFTDSAVLNINNLTKSLANKGLESYFLDTGLEYRFGRVPIGGTDFSTRPYTLDDVEDGGSDFQLARFSLAEEDVKYRLPLLRSTLAMSSHEIELFATAWTAPAWMKTNNKLCEKDGQLKGKPGGEYYKTWSHYYVKFLKAYEANGVALWGLKTGNEPSTPFYSEYALINDMGFTPDTLRDFLKLDLGPTLKEAGFGVDKLKILAPDADLILLFDNYVDAILQDAEASKYVYGIAFHGYQDNATALEALDREYAEVYTLEMLTDIQHWTAAWVDWNLALNEQGGPNYLGNFIDSPIIVNASANEFYKQPMFYTIGHLSKFVPPGSRRIQVKSSVTCPYGGEDCSEKVTSVVFVTPDGSTVLIVMNRSEQSLSLSVSETATGKQYSKSVSPRSILSFRS